MLSINLKHSETAIALWPLFVAGTVTAVHGGDVASYRGPQNNGIYDETGLMRAWPAEGPKLLWKQRLAVGYGGVSVVDGIVWIV
jgi:hypothetical protein